MPESALETLSVIETAARRYAADYPPPRVPSRRFYATPTQMTKLTGELAAVPEVQAISGHCFSTPGLTAPLNVGFLASALVERVVDGASAQDAFDDLLELLRRKKAPIYLLKGLVGIAVDSVIELGDNTAAMRAESAPPSRAREEVFRLDRNGNRIVRGSVVDMPAPRAALIIRGEMTVILEKDTDWEERSELVERMTQEEENALTALTLSGPECAPFALASSSVIDHPAYPYSGFGHEGYGTYTGAVSAKNGETDALVAKKICANLRSLSKQDRNSIVRATDRLRRSRSHSLPVDRAIDLGIALEMIFLHDLDGSTELKYRAAIRAAWFLGQDGPERQKIFAALKRAYDARSKAVHTGGLTDQRLIENLPAADLLCAEAIRRVITGSGFPDSWELLVLDDSGSD